MRNSGLRCITFIIYLSGMSAKGQTTSNEGLDSAIFPTHIPTTPTTQAKKSIYITAQNNSSGKINIGDSSTDFSVLANQIVEVPIDYDKAYISHNLSTRPELRFVALWRKFFAGHPCSKSFHKKNSFSQD